MAKNRRIIGLQNFKIFKDYQEFEIAPITILTGTNSSGKSSFVKAVKLLKENFKGSKEDYDQFSALNFQFPKIHLGGFDKVYNSGAKNSDDKLLFTLSFDNEIWGSLRVYLLYVENENSGFKNGLLESVIIIKNSEESDKGVKTILMLHKIKMKDPDVVDEKELVDMWRLYLNEDLWFEQFLKTEKKAEWQNKILDLHEYIWQLALVNGEDYLNYMDKTHSRFYSQLSDEGLSPVNPDFLQEISALGGDFDRTKAKKHFCYSISQQKYIDWNESADFFNQMIKTNGTFLSFPLFDRPEWKINFDDDGKFISNPLNSIDKSKMVDFNEEEFYKISELLINHDIQNKNETIKYFRETEKKVFKEIFEEMLKPENFAVYEVVEEKTDKNKAHIERIPGEYNNKLSDFLSELLKIEPYIEDMPIEKNEIDDFAFFDNLFSPANSRGLKNWAYKKNLDKNNKFEIWKPYQKSLGYLIQQVKSVVEEAFVAFSNLSEFDFVDTQNELNKRVFLDDEDSDFNIAMREYVQLKSIKSQYNSIIKFKARQDFINKWIKEFDISKDFLIERDKEGIGTRTYLINNEGKELLVDVGFGVNKLFSLILKIAVSPKNTTIFIEEPESNLHPAMQSKLADLFVDAHQVFGHYFVLETHSEYLIRKLQFLVASEKSSANAKDINIYYLFHPDRVPEGRKQVEKLEMRQDGILKQDFGKGFFDESVMLTLDLLRNQKSN